MEEKNNASEVFNTILKSLKDDYGIDLENDDNGAIKTVAKYVCLKAYWMGFKDGSSHSVDLMRNRFGLPKEES